MFKGNFCLAFYPITWMVQILKSPFIEIYSFPLIENDSAKFILVFLKVERVREVSEDKSGDEVQLVTKETQRSMEKTE